ncbi:MAG: response regulator [Dehalococcoidales bacterium]|nr:response regulator [Dehalococcoidales bacterium]
MLVLMPDVTGFDVLERVRAFSDIPIIVFTARPDVFKMAMSLGADEFVAKPFNPDLLVEKIGVVLKSARHKMPQETI